MGALCDSIRWFIRTKTLNINLLKSFQLLSNFGPADDSANSVYPNWETRCGYFIKKKEKNISPRRSVIIADISFIRIEKKG